MKRIALKLPNFAYNKFHDCFIGNEIQAFKETIKDNP